MSYMEYIDEFNKIQEELNPDKAPYAMLIVDVVGSKKNGYRPEELDVLVDYMATTSENNDTLVIPPTDCDPHVSSLYYNDYAFALGDLRGIVLDSRRVMDICWYERNCSPTELAWFIVDEAKRKTGYKRGDLHVGMALFETWKWSEGAEKMPFAYCVRLLEDAAKKNGTIA